MRLIDAEHLKRWILARWEKTDPRSEYPLRAIDIIDQLDREDTIEAEPVRHGKWIYEPKDAIEMMHTKPKCSECGYESADGLHYCSNCGAKMEDEG